MHSLDGRVRASFACALILAPAWTPAQERPSPAIRSTMELVKIDTSVLDKQGNFVGGLEQKQFRVLDDGLEQPIAYFAPVEAPAQILVMVETTPAVYLIHSEHLFAAYALLDGLAPEDQVALASYDQAPHAFLLFTPSKAAVAAALGQIQYTLGSGQLNFYDSVSTAVDWLAPVPGKKALVLLTTGLDSSPPARWDALVEKLRTSDVVIYSIALGGSLRRFTDKKGRTSENSRKQDSDHQASVDDAASPLSFAKADEALRSLASATGGRAYFPQSASDFAPMYREIASALRHQYVLGIAPKHDGQSHSLTVQLIDDTGHSRSASGVAGAVTNRAKQPELRIFARPGYLAPAP
jgi:Ca-activated chloride channel homolog